MTENHPLSSSWHDVYALEQDSLMTYGNIKHLFFQNSCKVEENKKPSMQRQLHLKGNSITFTLMENKLRHLLKNPDGAESGATCSFGTTNRNTPFPLLDCPVYLFTEITSDI